MALMINGKKQKIAMVKQDVHQDLFNCAPDAHPYDKILSTRSRTGPGGLFTLFDADYYTIREHKAPECRLWTQKAVARSADAYRKKHQPRHAKHTINAEDVDWSKYDIILSMDITIPYKIVDKCPKTLWLYMVSEPYMGIYNRPVLGSYDAALDQNLGLKVASKLKRKAMFPYTFIGPNCLKDLVREKGNPKKHKKGVYRAPESKFRQFEDEIEKRFGIVEIYSAKTNDPQHKIKNFNRLMNSKYFVKMGGNKIRGNGIVEAIGLGTLVITRPSDIIYTQLIHPSCFCANQAQLMKTLNKFERNPELYKEALKWERNRLKKFVMDNPTESLKVLRKMKL